MRKPHEILNEARERAGLHFGWQKHAPLVHHHHNGTRGANGITKKWAETYTKAYNVDRDQLMMLAPKNKGNRLSGSLETRVAWLEARVAWLEARVDQLARLEAPVRYLIRWKNDE
jgi:hypothetical protein